MQKMKSLFIINLIVKISIGLICAGLAFNLFVVVHSTIAPQYYDKLVLNQRGGLEYTVNLSQPSDSNTIYNNGKNLNIPFSRITFTSKIFIFLRILLEQSILLLILFELLKISFSIKKHSSFFVNNSIYFKRIGVYLIIYLAYNFISDISGVHVSMNSSAGVYRQAIPCTNININDYVTTLLFMTMAFIASTIFKEGERIRIDNELTV